MDFPLKSLVVQSLRSCLRSVGPLPKRSMMVAVASVSKLLVLAISHWSLMLIRLMTSQSSNRTMSSLSVSFSGTKSGHCDSVLERIILDPGRWTSLMSYSDRRRDHRACHRLSFWALRKYMRFLWSK